MKRNYGIDLLRIVSMFMVLILHILHQGGIESALVPYTTRYQVMWFLEIGCYCAVNCYALISGYVGVTAKYKFSNFLNLWSRVVFYTVSITAIFYYVYPGTVGLKEIMQAILPVSTARFWYLTGYFVLFLFMPLLNLSMERLNKKQSIYMIIAMFTTFSVVSTMMRKEVFVINDGFSGVWLMVLYVMGGCFRKTKILEKLGVLKAFLGYLCMVGISLYSMNIIPTLDLHEGWKINEMWLINYISPTIVLSAIFLLTMFSNMRLPKFVCGIIRVISPLAFSVYIIHCHPLIMGNLLTGRFAHFVELSVPELLLRVLQTAAIIFVICASIDWVRSILFKLLGIPKFIQKIDNIGFWEIEE